MSSILNKFRLRKRSTDTANYTSMTPAHPKSKKLNNLFKLLIEGCIAVLCTYFFPFFNGAIEANNYAYRAKETAVIQLIESSSSTITLFDDMAMNYYKQKNEAKSRQDINKYKSKVDLDFEKISNMKVPYEMACSLVKIQFPHPTSSVVEKFKTDLDEFIGYDLTSLNSKNLANYEQKKVAIWDEYELVLKILTEELSEARRRHVFYTF